MSFKSLMKDTCTIRRPTITQSANMSAQAVWGNIGEVRCRFRQLSDTERTASGRMGVISTHRLYVDAGTDVKEKDEIQYGSVYYKVTSATKRNKARSTDHLEVDVYRID